MKKYLVEYLRELDKVLQNSDKSVDFGRLRDELKTKIEFAQHERFIHLIVTCLISVLLIMSVMTFIATDNQVLILLILGFLGLDIPYIMHYYFMENTVQSLYHYYDRVVENERKGILDK